MSVPHTFPFNQQPGPYATAYPIGNPPTLPSMLVQDVIYVALRLAGIFPGPGRGASADMLADAFEALNMMFDFWSTNRLMVYTIGRQLFNLNSSQQVYQIGSGAADFNVPRPPKIELAGIVIESNPQQPLELPMALLSYEDWRNIPVKNITCGFPLQLYYDAQFPVGNINVYPVPTQPCQLALYLWQTMTPVAQLTSPISFPPGYLKAIEYNLAVELAPRWPDRAKLSPLVIDGARMSLAWIKSINAPMLTMECDAGVVSRRSGFYNWVTDSMGRT
jgi:hypothetical protein